MSLLNMSNHPPWLKDSKNLIIFQVYVTYAFDVMWLLRSKVNIKIIKIVQG